MPYNPAWRALFICSIRFPTIIHRRESTLFCISEPFKTCDNRLLYYYGSTRTGDHEHRTTLSDSLIIEVNTNDSVSTK